MKTVSLALAATLIAGTALAQVAPSPRTGAAAASGDTNQAVATTSANAVQPARGRNSFSAGEARRRIERGGFQQVTGLRKDGNGVWRGTAMRDGTSVPVWLDYKGNVSPGGATPASDNTSNPPGSAVGRATDRALGTNATGTNPGPRNLDGTTGNPPGTAAGRLMDRTLGTNTTGANPTGATRQ